MTLLSQAYDLFVCIVCGVTVEMRRFTGSCRCWHCGRQLFARHECNLDGTCDDYVEPEEE